MFTRENKKIFSIVAVVTLFIYSLTVAKNITTVDSGELAIAIKSLGVAHPPGAPFYVLVGQFAKLLPLANLAAKLAWLSAILSCLTAGIVALIGREFLLLWRDQFQESSTLNESCSQDHVGADVVQCFRLTCNRLKRTSTDAANANTSAKSSKSCTQSSNTVTHTDIRYDFTS